MKTKIGKRIRGFRRFLGMSQKEFGQKIGLSYQHISRYEQGKITPSGEVLVKICESYNINLNWLLIGKGFVENESLPDKLANVVMFSSIGAGHPIKELERSEHPDFLPREFFKPSIKPINVSGHSMEPTIFNGAYVGVDTDEKQIISGEIYALRLQHEGIVIKRLFMEVDRVTLRSDNPSYPLSSIPIEKLPEDFIVGRVKWVIQKLY
ncbi:MAG: XRE family transcriptional regulator [Nitrospirae bacterium]|nr:XRE family transcriptional regulator [Nitrospirota bacterium]